MLTSNRVLCAALFLSLSSPAWAQQAGMPPSGNAAVQGTTAAANSPLAAARRQPPQPAKDVAPGGAPDKVWVNLNSSTYHCYGDRYYGKTANGRYMTEAAAKSAGAHGAGGKTCTTGK